ncbi:MAG: hypothetical protein KGJ57_19355 [Sphingomonadales bacterium]|nr:hypothetical protein [Sphingomonadales bacterium]MDE2171553.1 hypothetical protein [Sphingomonadales bacterium]
MSEADESVAGWDELSASYTQSVEKSVALAQDLYDRMIAHLMDEIARTGAQIDVRPPGTVLPKNSTDAPIALRMNVTYTTASFARQRHLKDKPGEKRRSWPIVLARTAVLPGNVKSGLTRMIEEVALLQGATPERSYDRDRDVPVGIANDLGKLIR